MREPEYPHPFSHSAVVFIGSGHRAVDEAQAVQSSVARFGPGVHMADQKLRASNQQEYGPQKAR